MGGIEPEHGYKELWPVLGGCTLLDRTTGDLESRRLIQVYVDNGHENGACGLIL